MAEAYDGLGAAHELDRGRRSTRWFLLLVLAWPAVLLLPSLVGARVFLPYDVAQFPPASLGIAPAELERMRAESNFDVTETPVWFVPELQVAQRALAEDGTWPAWNPGARTGTALSAHGHHGLWHPTTWLAMAFADPARGLGWVAFANLAIAGALAFGFLLRLRMAPAAAAFGALAFAASSTLAANAHNYPRLASLIWLPGMLWAVQAIAAPRRSLAPGVAGFAATFAMTWCGGFPPYAVPCSLVAGGYALSLALVRWRADGARTAVALLGACAAAALLGAMLAAPYLLPAHLFFGESARSLAPDLQRVSQIAFERYGLLGWLAPDLFGRPDLGGALPYERSPLCLLLGDRQELGGKPLLPNFNSTEYAVFPGTLVLWCATAGAASTLLPRARRHGLAWYPLVAAFVLLAMASFQPGFRELFRLPAINVVPPLRCIGPIALLVAWLAAQGLDVGLRQRARWPLLVGAGGAAIAAALALWFAGEMRDPGVFARWQLAEHVAERFRHLAIDPGAITAGWVEQNFLRGGGNDFVAAGRQLAADAASRQAPLHLLAALALVALALAAVRRRRAAAAIAALFVVATFVELRDTALTFDRGIAGDHPAWTPVHEFLVERRAAYAAAGGFMVARAAPPSPTGEPVLPTALPVGTLQPHAIRDLQVYTFFDARSVAPLRRVLGERATAKGYVSECLPDDLRLSLPLFDLLGLRYVLATTELQHAGERVGPRLRGNGREFFVYERGTALPRAFVVPRLEVLDDDDAVLAAITAPDFRPREVAYTTAALLPPEHRERAAAPTAVPSEGDATHRTVRFAAATATRIELEIPAGAPGWLVLADTALGGWRATVDDAPLAIATCDHALRAVPIGGEACRVVFEYEVPGLRSGLWLSTFSTIVLLALVALSWRSSRGERAADIAT